MEKCNHYCFCIPEPCCLFVKAAAPVFLIPKPHLLLQPTGWNYLINKFSALIASVLIPCDRVCFCLSEFLHFNLIMN